MLVLPMCPACSYIEGPGVNISIIAEWEGRTTIEEALKYTNIMQFEARSRYSSMTKP